MEKKSKRTGKISSGNKTTMNLAKEERRQARFARRKEEGKVYEYQPNPYDKDSSDPKEVRAYNIEATRREEKNTSHKTSFARFTSIMRKLDNELTNNKMRCKKRNQSIKEE